MSKEEGPRGNFFAQPDMSDTNSAKAKPQQQALGMQLQDTAEWVHASCAEEWGTCEETAHYRGWDPELWEQEGLQSQDPNEISHWMDYYVMTHGVSEYLPTMPDTIEFTSDSLEQSEHFIDFSTCSPSSPATCIKHTGEYKGS